MAFGKGIGLKGLTYQGGGPMLAWLLHRITALGMVFIGLHVFLGFFDHKQGLEWARSLNTLYESLAFQLFIYFCVIFHTLNGLRITLLDFWPQFLKYQREAIWIEWAIVIPVYGLTVFLMVQAALAGG